MDISKVIEACETNWDSNEKNLQCQIAKALNPNYEEDKEFSPYSKPDKCRKFNSNASDRINTELGVWPVTTNRPIYIDLASAEITGNENENPISIDWLCEIKVFKPSANKNTGRFYPWVYKYDQFPNKFNFIQTKQLNYIITDADEGQIFKDIFKMIRCTEILTKPPSPAKACQPQIYQLIAIAEQASKSSSPPRYKITYEGAIKSLQRIFEVFNENICKPEYFDYTNYGNGPIVTCCSNYRLTGKVVWLECLYTPATLHGYHHILIEWKYESISTPSKIILQH